MKNKMFSFETITSDFELVNTEFMRVKINVCHSGKNRNHTIIEQDVLDKMSQSVYGVPVVGEIDWDEMKFKGHGGKLEISNDGFEFIQTTVPYGFVDPTIPVTYEKVLESDGMTYNDYFTISAMLWKGRYPELVEIFEKQTVKQSMEIRVEAGDWDEDYNYFNITDAKFSALCLINVEPCFSGSKATVGYSLEDSQALYQEMMDKFKQFTLESTGGEVVLDESKNDETKDLETEVAEEVEVENVEETETDSQEETESQTETEVEEVSTEPQTNDVEEDATDEPEQTVSTDDDSSEVEEDAKESIDYQALLEQSEVEFGKIISKLTSEKDLLQEKVFNLETELGALREFKKEVEIKERQAEIQSLADKFSEISDSIEFKELFANADKYSIQDLDDKCYAILGRIAKSKKTNKATQTTKITITTPTQTKNNDTRYGGLLFK